MEMHLDELPENLRGDKKVILQLIEKRRRKIEQQLLMHHPEILDHLKKEPRTIGETAGKTESGGSEKAA